MVDSVSGVSNSSTASSTSSAAQKTSVDYDAFLSLLVTQLKNQDPTEPTDNAQLMSQLASFSAVEQQIQTNEKLDSLLSSNALGDASNMIGKTISSANGDISGKVVSVILTENGVAAELENGTRVTLGSGTRISE